MDHSGQGIFVERTLALIKPDAIDKAIEIETVLLRHGFTVLHVRFVFFLVFLRRHQRPSSIDF